MSMMSQNNFSKTISVGWVVGWQGAGGGGCTRESVLYLSSRQQKL